MNIAGAFQLGFIYSFLTLGVYISFRIMNVPDLTADGSFTLGLCVSAVLTMAGHPLAALAAAVLAGALSGCITALLHTKAAIHPILAGILTMTALYSVCFLVTGGAPNVSLAGGATIFSLTQQHAPFLSRAAIRFLLPCILLILGLTLAALFFKTTLGLRIRAAGSNEQMLRTSSINTDRIFLCAIAISNALIAFSGALLAQYQGYGDVNAGNGIVVTALASVILGEILPLRFSTGARLAGAAAGAVIYRFLIAFALHINILPAYMLKFLSAFIVALTLASPAARRYINGVLGRKNA
jgi:putative ABC transport system permease protein